MVGKYKAYPEYKNSGVEWLGNLPCHWTTTKLKYTADLVGQKVTQSFGKYVGMENISSGDGKYLPKSDVQPDGVSNSFQRSDVLFGKLRPYLAKSWVANFSGICSSEFLVLRSQRIHPKFLNYFMLTEEFIDQVNSSTYGSKMPRASWDFISLLPVPVPSFAHTKKIADFLDHETSRIDGLIEKQQRLIALLKEKRQAVISHAVNKGLNPDAPLRPSGVEWLGDVPAHWEVVRIKHMAKLESGHTPDKKKEEYWVNCTIPWVSLNDTMQLKKVDYISETAFYLNEKGIANSSARKLPKRAVVFTRDASIGLSAITTKTMAVSQHLIAWICDMDKIIPEYLLLVFYAMQDELERYTFGATLKTIGMSDVNKLICAIPSTAEQDQIITHVFHMKEKIDKAVKVTVSTIALLNERRTALISAAVTGKIDVRDWEAPTQSINKRENAA